MSTSYQFDLLRTYRYLRLAMVLIVILLFISVATYIGSSSGQMLQSISASYYTPVRAVFVSSLCAIGTCLIVYQGNTDVEDVLLNGSGFFAFIVGFVPTRPEEKCVASAIPQDVRDAITNNVTALMSVAVIAFAVVMGIQLFATPASENGPVQGRRGRARVLGAGVPRPGRLLRVQPWRLHVPRPQHRRHPALHRDRRRRVRQRPRPGPQAGQGGRPTGPGPLLEPVLLGLRPDGGLDRRASPIAGPWLGWLDHWVFWLEAALIAQFGTFWLTQTLELWREPRREDAPVAGA